MTVMEREATLRAAAARRWTGVYAALGAFTFLVFLSRASAGLLFLLALLGSVFWVLCLVASVRALQHGKEYGHDEGRGAAFFGLFLTLGCVGLLVAYLLHPGTQR